MTTDVLNRVSQADMANAVRALSMDAIHRIQTGHPGLPMGAADFATVLFTQFLKFDTAHPEWPDRDRFVLSAGHGSAMLYALGHLVGYPGMTIEDIKRFRRVGSRTPGHPEVDLAIGVEATTGPLGQGIGMGVGMALAERMMADRFGADLVDHHTYVLAGDGCLMEGLSYESAALAGHLKLNKLIVLFDDNQITIDGPTILATSEDQQARFEACGWHWVATDGHDAEATAAALAEAKRVEKPCIVALRTTIGYSFPTKAGTAAAHGVPPDDAEVAGSRKALGWPHEPFVIPAAIEAAWRQAGKRSEGDYAAWAERLAKVDPDKRKTFLAWLDGDIGEDWRAVLAIAKKAAAESPADQPTRVASKKIMEALVPVIPNFIGGSADLTPSNLSRPDGFPEIAPGDFSGRYIHYGVREHAMAAITNGLALHKGLLPYCATFLCFSDYCKPAIRLTALMEQKVVFLFTHDTITQGPDGPTHQPVEHFVALRAIPNLLFLRPADAIEAAECWELLLESKDQPVCMISTREAVPQVRFEHTDENLCRKGAYVFAEADGAAQVTILATGSEVCVARDAREILQAEGIATRVVSMPCLEIFDAQPEAFRQEILGPGTLRVSVEAAAAIGWERYVGQDGLVIGMTTFGASGMTDEINEHFGFTGKQVAAKVKARLT